MIFCEIVLLSDLEPILFVRFNFCEMKAQVKAFSFSLST